MWSGPGCYASYLHLLKSSNFYFPSLKTLTQERKDMHFRIFESLLLGSITALSLWLLENHWSATGQWDYNYVCTLLKVFAFPPAAIGFPGGSDGKLSAYNAETWVWSLGRKDPLEKGMATHSSIPAWRLPWTEEPGKLHPWDHKESDMTEWLTLSFSAAIDQ